MNNKVILCVDQSTSGTKSIAVDNNGKIIANTKVDQPRIFDENGIVEQDPMGLYNNVKKALNQTWNKCSSYNLASLAITNQRETIMAWNKETGIPIYNAIVWQDRRTIGLCKELKSKGYESVVKEKTGLPLDPYFSATKLKWILDEVEGARELAAKGSLLAGTVDTWLVWKLTNGKVHATDYSNASRTLLFNINTLEWDEELLHLFTIPRSILPVVKDSNAFFGKTLDQTLNFPIVPITSVIGDSQAAAFGQKCFSKGMAKATYGTGTSILVYTGEKLEIDHGLVTSIAWSLDGNVHYAIEGIINSTGDTLQWLTKDLGLEYDLSDLNQEAFTLDDNKGVYIVPAFSGLGAPFWKPEMRAAIFGIKRDTNEHHLIRAGIESIAYQVKDIIDLVDQTELKIKSLRADGGAAANQFLMQFQSDLLNHEVKVLKHKESSALGAVYLSGLHVGFWKDLKEIEELEVESTEFQPKINSAEREDLYSGWRNYVRQLMS